jgi:1,4-alpha-glucan branching enzyme
VNDSSGTVNRNEIANAELERLIALRHPNPHSILGAHPSPAGITIRAFRPGAKHISVIAGESHPWRMARVDPRGLFEVLIKDRTEVFPYQLRVQYSDNEVVTIRDPYAFLPTIGSVDLHLWNEGRHERIYEKLGAHILEIDKAVGFAFAVWAPNARGFSVVGDFNDWDGRIHMMRSLGPSGIWELFIPGIGVSARYKFEIRTWNGDVLLKADPFATATEAPPATASMTYQSTFVFGDGEWREMRGRELVRPFRSTKYIWDRGGACRKRATDRSPIANWRRCLPITSPTWASRTSS